MNILARLSKSLQKLTLSKPVDSNILRTTGRLVEIKGQVFLALETFYADGKNGHQNIPFEEAADFVVGLIPDTYKQIVYGTDFCPPILLWEIDKYDYSIRKIFTEDQFEDIYWNNPLRAFPKVAQYLNMKG